MSIQENQRTIKTITFSYILSIFCKVLYYFHSSPRQALILNVIFSSLHLVEFSDFILIAGFLQSQWCSAKWCKYIESQLLMINVFQYLINFHAWRDDLTFMHD